LFYELDDTELARYRAIQQALVHLSESRQIWRIVNQVETHRQKYNAGASSLIQRTAVAVGAKDIPKVKTNLPVSALNLGAFVMYFLPDMILYQQGSDFASISYDNFDVKHTTTRFIEDEAVPQDATVVDTTWKYVNKNGGPDRRFNNNRKLPVCQYGVVYLTCKTGLNIHLNTSSVQKAEQFANGMAARLGSRSHSNSPPPPPSPPPPIQTPPLANALRVLGLSGSPSAEVLSAAYHRLAQMYHPDKVAGLAPEFQTLAHDRMREINGAYDLAKQHLAHKV
jgi:hypothetical protein